MGCPPMMRHRITHATTFNYDGRAGSSYNEARLTPRSNADQLVVHSRIEVTPTPFTYGYTDYFGTFVHTFEVLDPHETMTVTAVSTVQVQRRAPVPAGLAWHDLEHPRVSDRWTEYLAITPVVESPPDLTLLTREIADSSATPGEAARRVCELLNDEVAYEFGATDVESHAAAAWDTRKGVCQDLAHLAIGSLRRLGIPTRYVSGYLHPSSEPVVGETVVGESHAWVEWWDGDWCAFDPTNRAVPEDRYVVVATGRDYGDVRPLGGVFSGAGTSGMQVRVEVTRLA